MQEAFITAYKSIKKLEKGGSFSSWLGRIVTTRAYDLMRKRQGERKAVEGTISTLKTEMSHAVSNPAESREDFDMDLREAITRLPELHRLAILLRYSEDASIDEIVNILNRPAGTIRRILSESYRWLRLYFTTQDIRVASLCGLVCIMSTQAGRSGFVIASQRACDHMASQRPACCRQECTLNYVPSSQAGQWSMS